jgi:hypothetical protein
VGSDVVGGDDIEYRRQSLLIGGVASSSQVQKQSQPVKKIKERLQKFYV